MAVMAGYHYTCQPSIPPVYHFPDDQQPPSTYLATSPSPSSLAPSHNHPRTPLHLITYPPEHPPAPPESPPPLPTLSSTPPHPSFPPPAYSHHSSPAREGVTIIVKCPSLNSSWWCLKLYATVCGGMGAILSSLWVLGHGYVLFHTESRELRIQR